MEKKEKECGGVNMFERHFTGVTYADLRQRSADSQVLIVSRSHRDNNQDMVIIMVTILVMVYS